MKKKYHIIIEDTHKAELCAALAMLDVKKQNVNSRGERDAEGILTTYTEYVVELTKYELLFLRLACSTGEFKKVVK